MNILFSMHIFKAKYQKLRLFRPMTSHSPWSQQEGTHPDETYITYHKYGLKEIAT